MHVARTTLALTLLACQSPSAPVAPVAPVASVASVASVAPATSAASSGTPHLDAGELVDERGARHAAPAGKRWVDLQDDVALLGPADPASDDPCEVVDARTLAPIAKVTTEGTAAGGSNVVCSRLAAKGRVVVFTNSRGEYPKRAATNERLPGCTQAIFADDLSSCVNVAPSPMQYGSGDFTIDACDLASGGGTCRTLETIPNGLAGNPSDPRPWDAPYCNAKVVAVRANGRIVLHELPSGRPVGQRPATGQLCPR